MTLHTINPAHDNPPSQSWHCKFIKIIPWVASSTASELQAYSDIHGMTRNQQQLDRAATFSSFETLCAPGFNLSSNPHWLLTSVWVWSLLSYSQFALSRAFSCRNFRLYFFLESINSHSKAICSLSCPVWWSLRLISSAMSYAASICFVPQYCRWLVHFALKNQCRTFSKGYDYQMRSSIESFL